MSTPESYAPRVRLFIDGPRLGEGATLKLASHQVHYLRTVLRLGEGAHVALFNGQDGEWRARIARLGKKDGMVECSSKTAEQESVPDLWLVFAPIKRGRIDWLVEKATELGVARLIPVITRRTVVARLNHERLRAHAIEAAEQCGRTHVPPIEAPKPLPEVLAEWPAGRRLMFCDELKGGGGAGAAMRAQGGASWGILTGPEGGFEAGERAMLAAHPASLAVSLGPRILRADTAAVAALTLWQATLGDW
ncbi:MAG: 16S rRNA (uracil(1498)-N(3))-methyltransferase [Pseudomonadota bacterium]